MFEYKLYDRSYEDEVLKVFTESFVNYPLFWGVFEDRFKSETELRSFYERLMKGIFRATVRKDDCYIGIADGKVKVIVSAMFFVILSLCFMPLFASLLCCFSTTKARWHGHR